MASIAFEDVSKVFPDGTRAVDGLDLEIADGEFTMLVGPSGSGKSTALRMVAGLEDASSGAISIGRPRRQRHRAQGPRHRDGVPVLRAVSAHDASTTNMGFALKMQQRDAVDRAERVLRSPARLGIERAARAPAARAVAAASASGSRWGARSCASRQAFLMDEPLSNLDAKLRVEMRAYIARLHQELGTTTLYVTHDQTEAMTMGDRVAVMRDGRLEQVDAPQRLYEQPGQPVRRRRSSARRR